MAAAEPRHVCYDGPGHDHHGSACHDGHVYTCDSPGLGVCLFTVHAVKRGEVVLQERPVLLSSGLPLPPLAVFAPIDRDLTKIRLLEHVERTHSSSCYVGATSVCQTLGRESLVMPLAPVQHLSTLIGGPGAWPQDTSFEMKHLALALEFLDATPAVQKYLLPDFHVGEASSDGLEIRSTDADGNAEPGKVGLASSNVDSFQSEIDAYEDNGIPVAELCALAGKELRARGAPWREDDFPTAALAGQTSSHEHQLDKLLRIFAINTHSFNGKQVAMFDVGTKIAHSCHDANVLYHADAQLGVGVWTALSDIPAGTMLTSCYLEPKFSHVSRALRRRILYSQKGFICACESCRDMISSTVPLIGLENGRCAAAVAGAEMETGGCAGSEASSAAHAIPGGTRLIAAQCDGPYLLGAPLPCARPTPRRPDKYRRTRRGPSCGTLLEEETFLEEEEALTNSAMMDFYFPYPSDPEAAPMRMDANLRAKLHVLQGLCELQLSDLHFVTQALRRVELTQQYTELMYLSEVDAEKAVWREKWNTCEQYMAECQAKE